MASLNIVNKSPFEKHSLEQCLSRVSDGSGILLIEDAVVAAVQGTAYADRLADTAAATTVQFYVLKPDLDARGFAESQLLPAFTAVDYPGFVVLVTQHDRVNSWL